MRQKAGHSQYNGLWPDIISRLAPELRAAVQSRPRHVLCPVHGGKDGLRCFNDFDETGGMICNTCGAFPNGYLVLAWTLDIPIQEAVQLVRNFSGSSASREERGTLVKVANSIPLVYPVSHDGTK
ncbi:hypothetical protein EYC87_04980 [Halieaceae bacterium IMCC8485]|uniref:DNA primase/helicase Gp4 N-terminal Bacteriophage T7-like domain-containing protein n=1 Tax=Candidatus Seongchinamella marina TaxID=2518990 RepID=A0ABT3SSI9_9GAMM|nr:hypothetical protein [Candidatus Seongchinamella marina]